MGRQAKLKARRRAQGQRRRTARFSVVCPGMLEVLSIGKGDLKIEIGDSNQDRAKAQELIHEMLRKGYTLFVETPDGPAKVTRFDPDQMAYVVAGTPDVVPEPEPTDTPGPDTGNVATGEAAESHAPGNLASRSGPGAHNGKGRHKRTVPVAGSKTTAIGRTAGG